MLPPQWLVGVNRLRCKWLSPKPPKDSGLTLGMRAAVREGLIIELERFAYPSGLFGECASGKNRTQNYCEQDDPATGRHDREDQAASSCHYLSVQTNDWAGPPQGRAAAAPHRTGWPGLWMRRRPEAARLALRLELRMRDAIEVMN